MFIELDAVTHQYEEDQPEVLTDINCSIEQGEFIGLIGHTGSGKSTLVQLLSGLITPTAGRVIIDHQNITGDDINLKRVREKVGLVFQYPEHQLFEETVYQDIAFGPLNLGCSQDEVEQRVIESLESVNLDYEEFKDRSPFKLSGGQQRRIAIAGVLAMKPQVLILDEPTAGLDPKSRVELMTEITKFKEKHGLTVLLISHRMEEIFNLADRILVLHQGKLMFNQPPAKLVAKHQQLKDLGLGIPKVTEVLFALQEQDFAVNTELFSVAAAKEEIIKVLRS